MNGHLQFQRLVDHRTFDTIVPGNCEGHTYNRVPHLCPLAALASVALPLLLLSTRSGVYNNFYPVSEDTLALGRTRGGGAWTGVLASRTP